METIVIAFSLLIGDLSTILTKCVKDMVQLDLDLRLQDTVICDTRKPKVT